MFGLPMGRKLGLMLMLISGVAFALVYQSAAPAAKDVVPLQQILQVISGTIFFIGLWLFIFKKLVITPWFSIDFSGEKPAVSVGFRGMRLVLRADPQPKYLQFGRVYVYASFVTRLIAKILICSLFYDILQDSLSGNQLIFAVVLMFCVLFGLEKQFNRRYLWNPDNDQARPVEPTAQAEVAEDSDNSEAVAEL